MMLWASTLAEGSRLEIVGDSKLVINWINGLWRCKYHIYRGRLAILHKIIEELIVNYGFRPRCETAEWSRHVYRELNGEADALAGCHTFTYEHIDKDTSYRNFRLFFDGSVTTSSSGGGWVLYGSHGHNATAVETENEWAKLAALSF
eukprot:5525708-Karenia_brevis.AAC.1